MILRTEFLPLPGCPDTVNSPVPLLGEPTLPVYAHSRQTTAACEVDASVTRLRAISTLDPVVELRDIPHGHSRWDTVP